MDKALKSEAIPIISDESPLKKLKLDTTLINARAIMEQSFFYGIRTIRDNISEISAVVVLRTPENEVLLEPILWMCSDRKLQYIALNFDQAATKLAELTG
jgi:hypothetical protein